jgi:hypothetical protein
MLCKSTTKYAQLSHMLTKLNRTYKIWQNTISKRDFLLELENLSLMHANKFEIKRSEGYFQYISTQFLKISTWRCGGTSRSDGLVSSILFLRNSHDKSKTRRSIQDTYRFWKQIRTLLKISLSRMGSSQTVASNKAQNFVVSSGVISTGVIIRDGSRSIFSILFFVPTLERFENSLVSVHKIFNSRTTRTMWAGTPAVQSFIISKTNYSLEDNSEKGILE